VYERTIMIAWRMVLDFTSHEVNRIEFNEMNEDAKKKDATEMSILYYNIL
jgi:hypothetical protein